MDEFNYNERQNRRLQARLSNKLVNGQHDVRGENAVRALDKLRSIKLDDGTQIADRRIIEEALPLLAAALFEQGYEIRAQPASVEVGYEVMQAARDARKFMSKVARMLDSFRDDMGAMLTMMESVDLSSARQSPDWHEDTLNQARSRVSSLAGFNVQSFIGDSVVADDEDDEDVEFPE